MNENTEVKIVTTYDPKRQQLIKQANKPNPWALSIRFCTFIKNTNLSEDQKYQCKRIRIKLTFETPEETKEMKKAILVHSKYCSPYIQTYYQVFTQKKVNRLVSIEARPYLYTLEEVLLVCKKEKLLLPKGSITFIRSSLVQIYKYILYLLNTNEKVRERLRYDICIKNLAFNNDYRLILINPCISQVNKLYSHIPNQEKSPGCVNTSLRIQITQVIKQLMQQKQPVQFYQNEDRGLLNFFNTEQKETFKIHDQMRRMYTWSSVEESQIPKALFEMLKLVLQPKIKLEEPLESKPLIEHFKRHEQGLINQLTSRGRSTVSSV